MRLPIRLLVTAAVQNVDTRQRTFVWPASLSEPVDGTRIAAVLALKFYSYGLFSRQQPLHYHLSY